jgi:O-phosphoseryl-tRNA(Cys) synthetase
MHAHHQQEGFHPAKYFSIDRVFRNEAIDRTHLAEFHQIEGEGVGWVDGVCETRGRVGGEGAEEQETGGVKCTDMHAR